MRNLEALLISKEVHKRPDFEPWIPVDIMGETLVDERHILMLLQNGKIASLYSSALEPKTFQSFSLMMSMWGTMTLLWSWKRKDS